MVEKIKKARKARSVADKSATTSAAKSATSSAAKSAAKNAGKTILKSFIALPFIFLAFDYFNNRDI